MTCNISPTNSAKIKLVKKLAILGSTGSIGHSTLSICESFPDRYQVISLAAGKNIDVAFTQCLRWRPKVISLATEPLAESLKSRLKAEGITNIEVVHGTAGSIHAATLARGQLRSLGNRRCGRSGSHLRRSLRRQDDRPRQQGVPRSRGRTHHRRREAA